MRFALATSVGLTLAVPAFAAPDVVLIVNRNDTSVELFWSTKGDQISPFLGTSTDWMHDENGFVPFEDLREGTFEGADILFEQVVAMVDGAKAPFEAMSLMVHPEENALPFATPLDALMSIEVCSVETPATPPTLADLQTYAGYFAYQVEGHAEIAIDFPQTGRKALDLRVLDYANGGLVHEANMRLADGGSVTLPATKPQRGFWTWVTGDN